MRGTLILVEVSRLPRPLQPPQQLWLWWHGPQPSDLAVVWRAYSRRFDLEHTFRFLKQALNWTLPRATPNWPTAGRGLSSWPTCNSGWRAPSSLTTLALALLHAKERLRHKHTVIHACFTQVGYHV
jgi:hypothetical protein